MNETVWDFLNKEGCSKAKQSPIRSGQDKLKQAKFSKHAIIGQSTTKKPPHINHFMMKNILNLTTKSRHFTHFTHCTFHTSLKFELRTFKYVPSAERL